MKLSSKSQIVKTMKLCENSINCPSIYNFVYLFFAYIRLHLIYIYIHHHISIVKSQTYTYQTPLRKKIKGKHPTDIPNVAAGSQAQVPEPAGRVSDLVPCRDPVTILTMTRNRRCRWAKGIELKVQWKWTWPWTTLSLDL